MSKKQSNVFFETFCGELVEIVQDFDITSSFKVDQEGHMQEVRMPMTVSGFLMDIDDVFVYLSNDGAEVNQAIPMDTIKHIGIVEVKSEMEEMLDEADAPNDPHGFN